MSFLLDVAPLHFTFADLTLTRKKLSGGQSRAVSSEVLCVSCFSGVRPFWVQVCLPASNVSFAWNPNQSKAANISFPSDLLNGSSAYRDHCHLFIRFPPRTYIIMISDCEVCVPSGSRIGDKNWPQTRERRDTACK